MLSRNDKNCSCAEVADIIGCSPDWVRKLVRRYNADPENGLSDERKKNGSKPILSKEQLSELNEALNGQAPDDGLWTGPKVALWMSQKLNRSVSSVTGWSYLVKLGWSLQVPRRQHAKSATPEEQAEYKKTTGKSKATTPR